MPSAGGRAHTGVGDALRNPVHQSLSGRSAGDQQPIWHCGPPRFEATLRALSLSFGARPRAIPNRRRNRADRLLADREGFEPSKGFWPYRGILGINNLLISLAAETPSLPP
jgi:hypothetical protein